MIFDFRTNNTNYFCPVSTNHSIDW